MRRGSKLPLGQPNSCGAIAIKANGWKVHINDLLKARVQQGGNPTQSTLQVQNIVILVIVLADRKQ
jgi:hypothetical protein